jgi:hypothetical protein
VFLEAGEDFTDIGLVLRSVLGEDEDIIQVHNNKVIEHISKDGVHEALEGGRSICETEVHDHEIEGTIASLEGSLPFVTQSDTNEIIPTL